MDISDEDAYKTLFNANRELILDHFEHTTKDSNEALKLIEQLYRLYFEGDNNFRGTRDYSRK